MTAPLLDLNDGHRMPTLGFGTYSLRGPEAVDLVLEAIETGYRLLDTATRYENEDEVGTAVARSGLARDDLFVTTKLPGDAHGTDEPRVALESSLERLGLDHVDLYLIHWPNPLEDKYVETWAALVALREAGLARSIGVSNFLPDHLDRIVEATDVAPAVNQVELHPYLPQVAQRGADAERDVVTQSWTPLGRGTDLLAEPVVAQVAEKHGVTPAQAVLRWHVDVGAAPIPKSATPERFRQNLDVFGFSLDTDDLEAFESLRTDVRIGGDPRTHQEF